MSKDMNDLIRARHRPPADTADQPAEDTTPKPDFDDGVRTSPPAAPDMSQLIRSALGRP